MEFRVHVEEETGSVGRGQFLGGKRAGGFNCEGSEGQVIVDTSEKADG